MQILYVEDDPLDIDLARSELHRAFPNLALSIATTVAQGMAVLRAEPNFDVVLTDLRLPDGSGLELLNLVRVLKQPAAVIVLTGQGDEEIAVAAIKAGADDYIAKRSGYQYRLPQIVRAALNRFRAEITRKSGLLRVLYAEHNQADIELTRRHLSQRAPHIELQTVYNATEVLARLPATRNEDAGYDVILLDFSLPGENALELLKVLYDERRLDLPVVLVTGQGDEEVAAQVLRLGAADYIVKHSGYLFELPVALENAANRAALAREKSALRASEERFRRLAENAPDLIYRVALAPERRFEYVSPAALALTGFTPEDHYADPDLGFKIVHPDDRHLLELASRGDAAAQQPLTLRWVRKDGSVVWAEQRNTLVFDDVGRLIALEGIARDVTQAMNAKFALEQRFAEMTALYHVSNALHTAQAEEQAVTILMQQTRAALQTDAAVVWLYDAEQNVLRAAAASGWCDCLRHVELAPGSGVAGAVFATTIPRIEREIHAAAGSISEPLAACAPPGWSGVWAPICTSRENVGVLFVAVPQPRSITEDHTKLLMSLSEMAGSMIQRLRLLHEAQMQAELTRQIVNTVPEGLALLDKGRRILLANPAARRHLARLGASGEDDTLTTLGARALGEFLVPDAAWQEINYGERTYLLNARPVEPASPNTAWVLVLDDVTSAREQQRYHEIQERLATVGQLAAGIAHDFNNVLGIVSVYSDIMLAAPNLTDKQRSHLGTIVQQAHHAANLVRQVLDFSRQSVMERTHLDLYPLVNEQVKLLRHTLPENIDIQLHADERHLVVNADPTRLRQVIMNLAINARDAMPRGGVLTITLSKIDLPAGDAAPPLPDLHPGAWMRLAIADTGVGIAPAHLAHLFEPFFTTKPPGSGTGLGLAQVYGIVKQHNGAIDVASTPEKGATFTIYLPLVAGSTEENAAQYHASPVGGDECILLVEDNAELRAALADSLTELGYEILAAGDAATALALAEEAAQAQRTVDLVITDLVLPGMSGPELYAAFKPLYPHAQLIVMTGHPMTTARLVELQQVEHWLQKPFVLNNLAQKVRQILGAGSSA